MSDLLQKLDRKRAREARARADRATRLATSMRDGARSAGSHGLVSASELGLHLLGWLAGEADIEVSELIGIALSASLDRQPSVFHCDGACGGACHPDPHTSATVRP